MFPGRKDGKTYMTVLIKQNGQHKAKEWLVLTKRSNIHYHQRMITQLKPQCPK